MAKERLELEEWEQQPGEKSATYDHFKYYMYMRYPVVKEGGAPVTDGTVPYQKRSLRKVAAAFGLNPSTIFEQSVKWNWQHRAEEYDKYTDRKNREANEAAIRKMNQEHALLAQQMLRKATRRLLGLPDDDISASDLVRMVDVAVKVERLSRGESTENQAVTHAGEVEVKKGETIDLSALSNEELDQFEQLLEKINGPGGD